MCLSAILFFVIYLFRSIFLRSVINNASGVRTPLGGAVSGITILFINQYN